MDAQMDICGKAITPPPAWSGEKKRRSSVRTTSINTLCSNCQTRVCHLAGVLLLAFQSPTKHRWVGPIA